MALNNPYALSFDGVDDYVIHSANPALNVQAHTVEFWIKPSRVSGYRPIFCLLSNQSSYPTVLVRIINSKIQYYMRSGVSSAVSVESNVSLVEDGIYHVAVVYTGTQMQIYLNGVLDKSLSSSHSVSTNTGMYLGRFLNQYYAGILDEFRFWSYARTQDQIQTDMYKTLSGTEAGLTLYYRCDAGVGTTLIDSSLNGLDATIYGATWVPGIVDLEEEKQGKIITGTITFRGRSSMSLAGVKRAIGSITFQGQSSIFLSAVKTAIGKITFRGGSFMSLIGLVLRELEGVYQISSSEIFSRSQPVLSTDLANYIEVWINPRVPAAEAEEVYRSKEPEPIPPGESKVFNLKLNKEPVIEAVASLEEAGANLSITNTKFYSGSAEITIRNSGATEQTCIIVIQAKPLELQGRRKIVVKDEESILDHGLVKYTFDSPLVQDEESARDIGEKILRLFSVARANIEIEWRGDPALELADIVQIPEFEKLGVSKKENFYITKQLLEVVEGGLDATLSGRKVPRLKEGD